jgi:hypothetical protein
MESLKLFLNCFVGVPIGCTCYVERNEQGEIVAPNLGKCGFVVKIHDAAIRRATDRLAEINRKEGVK